MTILMQQDNHTINHYDESSINDTGMDFNNKQIVLNIHIDVHIYIYIYVYIFFRTYYHWI